MKPEAWNPESGERWTRVEQLYEAALEREESQRTAFLDEACAGDEALRREVEILLGYAESFVDAPAMKSPARTLADNPGQSLVGRQLGSHHILSLLGAGGMGEVYRARDSKLRREVAIKVLSETFAKNPESLSRFQREARLLALLNHPNIAAIYGLEESAGVHYLVLELVPGQTLAERLVISPVGVEETLRICGQIAEALEAAHEKGVIHRDLKPANIKVTPEGKVKVLDFGLAKALWSEESSIQDLSQLPTLTGVQTQEGRILGTPAYMSPEQVRGRAMDKRTDIWSFGCVVYELLTGKGAFHAETLSDTLARVLEREPDWQALPLATPPKVREILRRCLRKDANRRLQDFADARLEMEKVLIRQRLSVGAGISHSPVSTVFRPQPKRRTRRKRIQSLVVLPLTNLSRDPEQEYFADGMTEALISDLAKLRALKIISRTSAMRYKATDKSLPEIAQELNVDAVIEGSVLRVGQRVRITAQLIHAATDSHLWAESYERDLQDVLALQSEVARAIAREIQVAVTPEETMRMAIARPVNPEAYDAYLKGRFHWYKISPQHVDTALEYFQLALEKDPNSALAYEGIAATWLLRGDAGFLPPREAFPKVKAALLKAMELDDTLAEVHVGLANFRFGYERDADGAEKAFQRAIQLNPNDAYARFMYSDFLISMKRPKEWREQIERTLELDPFNFFFRCFYGWHLVYLRRYDEAIDQLRKTLRTEPNFSSAHLGLWGALYGKQAYVEALAEAKEFFLVLGDSAVAEALERGYPEACYSGAMLLAAEKLAARSNLNHVPAIRIARLYAHAGEKDRALQWLEKAYEQREPTLIHLSVGWDWDSLRNDSRFQDLLRHIGLPS